MSSVGPAAPMGTQVAPLVLSGLRTILGRHRQFPWGTGRPDMNLIFGHAKQDFLQALSTFSSQENQCAAVIKVLLQVEKCSQPSSMTRYEGPATRINFCVLRDVLASLATLSNAKEFKIILEEIKGAVRSCWGPCALPVLSVRLFTEIVPGFTSMPFKRYQQIGKNTRNVPGIRTPVRFSLFWGVDSKEVI